MTCTVHPLKKLKTYKFVVVLSLYKGNYLLSRHQKRSTWETQGGHIEEGESPIKAAERELYEESGATDFNIIPAFDYWAGTAESGANGMVFIAEIKELAELPQSEMAETHPFSELPANLTYPDITPLLFKEALRIYQF